MNRTQAVGSGEVASIKQVLVSFAQAFPSLLLVFIVIGGILGGVFSATEASAVAVLYAVILGVVIYREVSVGDLPRILLKAAKTTSVVMILVGAYCGVHCCCHDRYDIVTG